MGIVSPTMDVHVTDCPAGKYLVFGGCVACDVGDFSMRHDCVACPQERSCVSVNQSGKLVMWLLSASHSG